MAKATKPADLRAKTAEELEALLIDLKREQFNLRFQRATGQNEGQARVRTVRREIARVKTIASQALKKNAVGAGAPAAKS
ncbi:50S ribosomal protein L29 [Gluconacetobacter diazotrophicus]|uniref:Large ribosomal subunit protein uL29 n=2 Tax=Gluconacetobacter diazotrophicus TaxID=33996 RepID=RL29_GLUDA|nr:50S ribosomal protein L29 [Gluconacetobacter diazotrophicus]A9H3N9.1 RecName: Full=Large ribosomal subunit protein uL29; AltName: Full=50S ribosomal protein L29 [Gluconacetobacter diazotrophicus PA1 5]MBB2157807.1 50S ribosomal protein L29 [Gluconacetobacter diazotrophicus]CAP57339.1 putative 50S ribosomal protein L29 [Gluconacetobacter diazotrophicus PA1 5]